jgi:hypothetical protein
VARSGRHVPAADQTALRRGEASLKCGALRPARGVGTGAKSLPSQGWREGFGAVAQLGERCNGIAEVRGSIPLGSTIAFQDADRTPPKGCAAYMQLAADQVIDQAHRKPANRHAETQASGGASTARADWAGHVAQEEPSSPHL